jgi:4-hydroxy-tetrahydrodipicolinate reductase
MHDPIKIAIGGSRGRMGQRLQALAAGDPRFQVTARFDVDEAVVDGPFDVVVEFSLPAGTQRFVDLALEHEAALVSGTTGLNEAQLQRLSGAAARIALLRADNFSVGINLLLQVLPDLARRLPAGYDIEIIETHHTQKVDAPSGTARALLEALCAATGRTLRDDVVFGREGRTGPKPPRQIGVHAVRSGQVVGRHEIVLAGPEETLTIQHDASSRDAFARGALEAAAWIRGREPGMYAMRDVLAS